MKRHSLLRVMKMSLPYWKIILMSALCVLAVNGAELAKPYVLKVVIDDFLKYRKPQAGLYSITAMGIAYMLLVLISSTLTYIQENSMNYVGQSIVTNVRRKIFSHIQRFPLPVLDRFTTGRLITRATNDVEAISELFTDVFINLFKDVFLLIGIVFVMLRMNVTLALIGFTVIPFIVLLTNVVKKKMKANFVVIKSLTGRINGFFAENISGMKLVQIFNMQREKQREFKELNDEYYKAALTRMTLNSVLRPAIEIFNSLAIAILIWYGMGRIMGQTLDLGVLYAFTEYIKQFFEPINDLAEKYNTIQSAVVSADRIFELLDKEEELEDYDSGIRVDRFRGDIEFRNVWFAYNDEDWVLKDVSFRIRSGQTAAFVGATGSGKTTIINLLSRFYRVQKGEILIDGININDINLRDLRRNIAVVLQDVFLFSGSIRDNITLNSDISEDRVEAALKLSCAEAFIYELPDKMDQPVTERGSTFSAGQRQLLAFARTIAHDPSIFVLDEATANIDTKTEGLIQRSIANVSKDRTTLIIAHRLSTIRNADVIFIIRKGRIIESGSHDELMALGGYYYQLNAVS
ncbi:MAG TPA: ABC transporter ATP-binding protein [Candidatus Atribacteria bacterium]|nr:ABC transporter ATP-binding protein [Candidatus Atribacteria bacterium]HPT77944.1 ABC transporter ATP-binding protein [Candidatus Atribacteria bacterium]